MYDVRPVEESDVEASWRLGALAFGYQQRERPTPKPSRADDPWCRWGAFDRDGGLVAKALDLHHEQWWGGRVLPASGIAGVAVQPEHRGTGAGRAVLNRALQNACDRGAAVATLFCTSTAVYRALGFEVGGVLRTVELPTATPTRTARICRKASTASRLRATTTATSSAMPAINEAAATTTSRCSRCWTALRFGPTLLAPCFQ